MTGSPFWWSYGGCGGPLEGGAGGGVRVSELVAALVKLAARGCGAGWSRAAGKARQTADRFRRKGHMAQRPFGPEVTCLRILTSPVDVCCGPSIPCLERVGVVLSHCFSVERH